MRDALASGENVLSAEDARELRDAEDRADSVDAELDFLAAKLAELAELDRMFSPNDASVVPFGVERGDRGDRADGGFDDFSSLTASMPPAAARVAASAAMDRAVRAGLGQSETAAAAARLEMQLGGRARAIEEMESASRMREMEFDRRVTELRLEHGRREAALLSLSERAATAEDERERLAGATGGTIRVASTSTPSSPTRRRRSDATRNCAEPCPCSSASASSSRALDGLWKTSSSGPRGRRRRCASASRVSRRPTRTLAEPLPPFTDTTRRLTTETADDGVAETHDDAETETGSLAPEDDAVDDDDASYWQTVPDAPGRSLPEPPRLPATPMGRREVKETLS